MTLTQAVSCPFCACLCQDLHVQLDEEAVSLTPPCEKALAGFAGLATLPRHPEIRGSQATYAQVIAAAAERLRRSRMPLVLLGDGLTAAAAQQAIHMARRLHACVDTPFSASEEALLHLWSEQGSQWLTLGEIHQSPDTLLFIGMHPATDYPRLWSRFIAGNAKIRGRLAAINSRLPYPKAQTPGTLHLEEQDELGLLTTLLAALKGKVPAPPEDIHNLAQLCLAAGSGLVLFDLARLAWPRPTLAAIQRLAEFLNKRAEAHWYTLPFTPGSGALTAMNALTTVSGFPASVRFTTNGPEYSPAEWSAETLLQSGEADLVVIVGGAPWLSPPWQEALRPYPALVLASQPPATSAEVYLPVSMAGIDSAGTLLRLDGIPISLSPLELFQSRPAAESVLQDILREVGP